MLVLTRKLDESIQISDNIKITILRIKGNTVRIGIEAPRDVRVVRTELTAAETPSAARSTSSAVGPVASQVAAHSSSSNDENNRVSTVTAIVDSPIITGPRLFVGTVAEGGQSTDLRADIACVGPSASGMELSSLLTKDQIAPLRAFLRSGRGLTAV